jgi:hypothetical protein
MNEPSCVTEYPRFDVVRSDVGDRPQDMNANEAKRPHKQKKFALIWLNLSISIDGYEKTLGWRAAAGRKAGEALP